jgi:hypothetical protein
VKTGWDNPQWLEGAPSIDLGNEYKVAFNLGWQDWPAFSKNKISLGGGATILDRNFKDTWRTGVASAPTNPKFLPSVVTATPQSR